MSNNFSCDINPSEILAGFKGASNTRKQRSLDIIYDILEDESRKTNPDYSIANIGRLSIKNGGPSTQSIRNKGGADYIILIYACAAYK